MAKPVRGEVWQVDLGMVAKVRPAVVLNIPFQDDERAVYAIVPHTTATRGGRFEIILPVPWLEKGAFDVQGLRHLPGSVFHRRLGILKDNEIDLIAKALGIWLNVPGVYP